MSLKHDGSIRFVLARREAKNKRPVGVLYESFYHTGARTPAGFFIS